jgi:ribosomal 50S subunit-recycling heat shock protein
MRLDRFLKVSRLVKRRSLAQEFCAQGLILHNGRRAKPGKQVKPGDRLELTIRHRRLCVTVLETPTGNVSKAEAATLYRIDSEEQLPAREYLP